MGSWLPRHGHSNQPTQRKLANNTFNTYINHADATVAIRKQGKGKAKYMYKSCGLTVYLLAEAAEHVLEWGGGHRSKRALDIKKGKSGTTQTTSNLQ